MQSEFILAAELLRSPIVVPISRRELHFLGIDHRSSDRSDEEVAAKKKISVVAVEIFSLRVVKKYRAHKRQARARAFFHDGVNIGQQFVTQFHVTSANGFVLWSVHPRLLVLSPFRGVVAVNGI